MAQTTDDELLAAALEIVAQASSLAATRFLEGSPVAWTGDGSPVTAADAEVEELLRGLLTERFPADGIAGEEQEETTGTSGRRWIIDPIDGTSYFCERIPAFEILLAAEDEDGTAIGVISHPMSQETYYAGRRLGCWRQVAGRPPERIRVSGRRQLRGAWVSMGGEAAWPEELLLRLHREVLLVSGWKGSSGVACGLTDALVIAGLDLGYHDIAPMPVLLAEAGGRVTDLDGNDVRAGNGTVLASNAHLHDALLELVRDLPTSRDYRALRQAGG